MPSSTLTTAPPGNDEDKGPAAVGVFWMQAGVAAVIVLARLFARKMIRALGADDWWMLLTLLVFMGIASVVTYQATLGGFRHMAAVDPQHMTQVGINNYILQTLGIFAFGSGKVSVGCSILRLLPPSSFWRKWILWSTIIFTFVFNCLNCILTFTQCNPPKALWQPNLPHNCWDPSIQLKISYVGSSYNILVDVLLALLPSTLIWKLQIDLRKRLTLCVLLGLGHLAAICGIVKITFLASLGAHADLTWETYNLVVWSGAEIFVIIVCGSIPPLKALWDRYISRSKRHRYGHSASPQYGSGAMDVSGGCHLMRGSPAANASSSISTAEKDVGADVAKGRMKTGIVAVTDIEITSAQNFGREVG